MSSKLNTAMRADIHDGSEHNTLQSEAGYIDARPHIRQIEEILLQHTAGPYIRVNNGGNQFARIRSASPQTTLAVRFGTAGSCHKETYAVQRNTWLLDYFVGGNLQCERNCEPQSLCCFQVDD